VNDFTDMIAAADDKSADNDRRHAHRHDATDAVKLANIKASNAYLARRQIEKTAFGIVAKAERQNAHRLFDEDQRQRNRLAGSILTGPINLRDRREF
jgi:hypothetical protein